MKNQNLYRTKEGIYKVLSSPVLEFDGNQDEDWEDPDRLKTYLDPSVSAVRLSKAFEYQAGDQEEVLFQMNLFGIFGVLNESSTGYVGNFKLYIFINDGINRELINSIPFHSPYNASTVTKFENTTSFDNEDILKYLPLRESKNGERFLKLPAGHSIEVHFGVFINQGASGNTFEAKSSNMRLVVIGEKY